MVKGNMCLTRKGLAGKRVEAPCSCCKLSLSMLLGNNGTEGIGEFYLHGYSLRKMLCCEGVLSPRGRPLEAARQLLHSLGSVREEANREQPANELDMQAYCRQARNLPKLCLRSC